MVKHFVVTRLGLGVYDTHRLLKLIDLFEAVTLSSLSHQSSQDFICLIGIDADMPSEAHKKLKALLAGRSNIFLVPIDVTGLVHVRIGGFDWIWDHYQDFILANGLLDQPHDYVVTSVIDADDAWQQNVVATINQLAIERIPGLRDAEKDRNTWLRHSSGIAITFPHGYVWFIRENKIWHLLGHEFHSMAVFIVARFSSGISACSSRHSQWRSYSNVLAFEVLPIETNSPMWVYARHDEAVGAWDSKPALRINADVEARLTNNLGIDLMKVQQWCLAYPSEQAGADYSGKRVADQYDRFFTIAAINRKIRVLIDRADRDPSAEPELRETIARCEAERAKIVAALRSTETRPSLATHFDE